MIANKAAANRILKEQHEESKTPITSDALSAESRYRLENRDGWRMQENNRERTNMNDLMTLSKKPLLDEALFRILGSTHASSQIDYSLHYEIVSKLFINRAHAGLEDDGCDLESWIYRLGSLCRLEDAEEIRTDGYDRLDALVDRVI